VGPRAGLDRRKISSPPGFDQDAVQKDNPKVAVVLDGGE